MRNGQRLHMACSPLFSNFLCVLKKVKGIGTESKRKKHEQVYTSIVHTEFKFSVNIPISMQRGCFVGYIYRIHSLLSVACMNRHLFDSKSRMVNDREPITFYIHIFHTTWQRLNKYKSHTQPTMRFKRRTPLVAQMLSPLFSVPFIQSETARTWTKHTHRDRERKNSPQIENGKWFYYSIAEMR